MELSDALAPRPLWSVTNASFSLDYPFMCLVDEESDGQEAVAAAEDADEATWALAGEGWIYLLSEGSGHTPVVTMEAWDAAPPDDDEAWVKNAVLVVTFPTGTAWLSGGTDGGSVGPPMPLPYTGSDSYNVRVQMRSADPGKTADELYDEYLDSDSEGDESLYVEFWRLQFWPTD